MRRTFWLGICTVLCITAQEPLPDVTHVLDLVRSHVQRLESSVPNFICKEQVTSRMYQKDKLKKETRAESILTTTRSMKEGSGIFSETRAGLTINGRATKRNEIVGPFIWQGGPAYGDLHYLFNSESRMQCRSYRLVGPVKLNGRDTLLLRAHAQIAQSECQDLPSNSADQIWLDPITFHVIRIESVNPPATGDFDNTGSTVTLTVDYAPVTFDGAEYWLPSHFISRLDFAQTARYFVYEAAFSDYHKYGAESVVHIDAEP